MTPATITIGLTILELILTKGVPFAFNVIKEWEKRDPTFSDIDALHALVKPPKEMFPAFISEGDGI